MRSIAEQFEKYRDERHLQPGETFVAANCSNPRGTMAIGTITAGAGVHRHLAARAHEHSGDAIADRLPSKTLILVLTDRRLAAFLVAGSGIKAKPGDLVCEYAPTELEGILTQKKLTTWIGTLVFVDGSTHELEFQKTAKPQEFFDLVNRWARGRR